MNTKKQNSREQQSIERPVHHGHPTNNQAEGERDVVDQALNAQEQQRRIDRQRSGREMRRSPQTGRQGKKVA